MKFNEKVFSCYIRIARFTYFLPRFLFLALLFFHRQLFDYLKGASETSFSVFCSVSFSSWHQKIQKQQQQYKQRPLRSSPVRPPPQFTVVLCLISDAPLHKHLFWHYLFSQLQLNLQRIQITFIP